MEAVESTYNIIKEVSSSVLPFIPQKQDQLVVHSHELRNSLDEVENTIKLVNQLPDKLEHKVMVGREIGL